MKIKLSILLIMLSACLFLITGIGEAGKIEAGENTVQLLQYLEEIYGSKILSGQQVSQGFSELYAIQKVTGKEPAILGFDFIDYSPSMAAHGAKGIDTDLAIKWWHRGGLVTFCWHWTAPMGLIDRRPNRRWYDGYNTNATTFDFARGIKDKNSREYRLLIRDIDVIARQLKRLQEEGVPVLWRPLHEAAGGWFWWGSQGPEPYIQLWRIMYDRLVNYHHLNNLIWVWNGEDAAWYPGDDLVDIVGIDFYGKKHNYSPRNEQFRSAEKFTNKKKLVALTETGVIPDPDMLIETETKWLWYMTWCSELVLAWDKKTYSEKYTEAWMLRKAYNHDYVITKEELPSFH